MPATIWMPLIWWLKQREEQGASRKQLARGWGVSVALFGVAMVIGVIYSGVKLRLMDSMDAVGGLMAFGGVKRTYLLSHVAPHGDDAPILNRLPELADPPNENWHAATRPCLTPQLERTQRLLAGRVNRPFGLITGYSSLMHFGGWEELPTNRAQPNSRTLRRFVGTDPVRTNSHQSEFAENTVFGLRGGVFHGTAAESPAYLLHACFVEQESAVRCGVVSGGCYAFGCAGAELCGTGRGGWGDSVRTEAAGVCSGFGAEKRVRDRLCDPEHLLYRRWVPHDELSAYRRFVYGYVPADGSASEFRSTAEWWALRTG